MIETDDDHFLIYQKTFKSTLQGTGLYNIFLKTRRLLLWRKIQMFYWYYKSDIETLYFIRSSGVLHATRKYFTRLIIGLVAYFNNMEKKHIYISSCVFRIWFFVPVVAFRGPVHIVRQTTSISIINKSDTHSVSHFSTLDETKGLKIDLFLLSRFL